MNHRLLFLALFVGFLGQCELLAQTADDSNEGTTLEIDEVNSISRFKWWGREGRTYFIQLSDDLLDVWQWVPMVEIGDDTIKEWGFTSTGDKFFLRLRHISNVPVAENVWAAFSESGTVNVGWSAPEPTGVTRWVIQRQLFGGEWETVGSTTHGLRIWEDTTLPLDTQAHYRVIGEVELESGAPIANSAATGTSPQGGEPGSGIQDTNYAGVPTTWWQQYFGGLAPEQRPSPDADVDLPAPDGMTNREEFEASVWVASKKKWIGPDPTKADTDGDGVNDLIDGWANVPEYAPARNTIATYALIDLGENYTPHFTNNRGDAVIKSAGGQWKFWRYGQMEAIEYGVNPLTPVDVDINGSVAVNGAPESELQTYLSLTSEGMSADVVMWTPEAKGAGIWHQGGSFSSLSSTASLNLLVSVTLSWADGYWQFQNKPLFSAIQNARSTFVGPPGNLDSGLVSWSLESGPMETLTKYSKVAAINDAGQSAGSLTESLFCREIENSDYGPVAGYGAGWRWPENGLIGGVSCQGITGTWDLYGFRQPSAEFFPSHLTESGVSIGGQLTQAGWPLSDDNEPPEGIEEPGFWGVLKQVSFSAGGNIHVFTGIQQIYGVSPTNHILGKTDELKTAFVMDQTAGQRLDQPTTAEPAYGSPFVWDEEKHGGHLVGGKLNARFQVLSGNSLWQNGKYYSLNSLVSAAKGPTPTWQILGGADLADNGIILATAKKLSDASNHAALLIPVEILVPRIDAEENDTGMLRATNNLKVAQWEHAWKTAETPFGELVDEFIEEDPDRFYVRVPMIGSAANTTVKVSTVDSGGSTINEWEEIEMEVDPDDSGMLISKSQLLVADDADKNAAGAEDAEQIAERMHKISLFGKVRIRIEFGQAIAEIDLQVPRVGEHKTVNIKAVILRTTPGGTQAATEAHVWDDLVNNVKPCYAQANINISIDSVTVADPPAGVDLGDGLAQADVNYLPTELKTLVDHLGTPATDDIYIFYVPSITTGVPGESGRGAKGFALFDSAFPQSADKPYTFNAFIGVDDADVFTTAHELGHLLVNSGHSEVPVEVSSEGSAKLAKEQHNLMFGGSILNRIVDNTILDSKRLWNSQVEAIRNNPLAR